MLNSRWGKESVDFDQPIEDQSSLAVGAPAAGSGDQGAAAADIEHHRLGDADPSRRPAKRGSATGEVAPDNSVISDDEFATRTVANSAPVAATSAPTVDAVHGSADKPNSSKTDSSITIADGATAEIDGPSAQSVTFAGSTGTLKLEDAPAFKGQISGLAGADAIDLADIKLRRQYASRPSWATRPAAR